jgi:hypothetical protein
MIAVWNIEHLRPRNDFAERFRRPRTTLSICVLTCSAIVWAALARGGLGIGRHGPPHIAGIFNAMAA